MVGDRSCFPEQATLIVHGRWFPTTEVMGDMTTFDEISPALEAGAVAYHC